MSAPRTVHRPASHHPARRHHGPSPSTVATSRALLAAVLAALALITLSPAAGQSGVNLVPGAGIALQLANPNHAIALLNLVGNVAVFVPVGLLAVPALRWSWPRVTLAGAALSTTIEVLQYRLGRASDVDDVLLNTAGTLAGALVAAAVLAGLRLARSFRDREPLPG